MYFLMFHEIPASENPESQAIGGAFVNCWIERPTLAEADAVARRMISQRQWQIYQHEDAYPISSSDYDSDPTGLKYYEQALIDQEVLVFHCYPRDERPKT